ncbi:MAG: hypothetical protein ACMUJM_13080 [bacterium]
MKKPEINPSLKSFIKKYKPTQAIIINLAMRERSKFDTTEILFLPYYELLFQDSQYFRY